MYVLIVINIYTLQAATTLNIGHAHRFSVELDFYGTGTKFLYRSLLTVITKKRGIDV